MPSSPNGAPDPPSRGPAKWPGAIPRRFLRVSRLRVRGRGRIVLELDGTGRVALARGRFDDFCFEGRGLPRHVSAQRVHLDRARGRLTLEGEQLELEFHGGVADVELAGAFEVDEDLADRGPSRRSQGRPPAA